MSIASFDPTWDHPLRFKEYIYVILLFISVGFEEENAGGMGVGLVRVKSGNVNKDLAKIAKFLITATN